MMGFENPALQPGFLRYRTGGASDRAFFLKTQAFIASMAGPALTCLEARV